MTPAATQACLVEGACPDHATIAARLRRGLDATRTAEIEAHMDRCTECRLVLSALARDLEHADVAPPECLGRYVLGEALGHGAMGEVTRAWDPELRRTVAIKTLRLETGEVERRQLLREAQLHARLSHPNVVPLYDVGVDGDTVYFAMELVEGESMAQWLQAAPRSSREILNVFVAAGRGLAAAHRAGIVHRDFKPANVLVHGSGSVKVTDFGVAKAATLVEPSAYALAASMADGGTMTRPGHVKGTPRYMAPEHHRGADLTPAADQYSFCVALWEALAGEPPVAGDDLLKGKLRGPPAWREHPEVPTLVVDAIRRGLSPDPEDRWPSMDALLAAIAPDESDHRRTYAASDLHAARRVRLDLAQGGVLALAIGSLYGLRTLGLHEPGYPDGLVVLALFAAMAFVSERRLARLGATATMRRAHHGLLATCGAACLLLSIGWAMGVAFTAALAFAMVLAASAAAWVAIALDWRFASTAVAFALTSITVPLVPEHRGLVLAAGVVVAFVLIRISFHLRPPSNPHERAGRRGT